MQRLNRSAHAPKGPAFFLVIGLAILPLSLRAAGLQVSFNPSLSAASDAWQQIADVFSAGYRPAVASDVAIPIDLDRETLKASADSDCSSSENAFASEVGEESTRVQHICKATVAASSAGGKCRVAAARSSASTRRAEAWVAAAGMVHPAAERVEIHVGLGLLKHARAFQVLNAMKLDTRTREELKNIDPRIVERSFETVKTLPIPERVRMFVRVKAPVTPSATRSAETKVRAALASARQLERACMTTVSPASPDNGEL